MFNLVDIANVKMIDKANVKTIVKPLFDYTLVLSNTCNKSIIFHNTETSKYVNLFDSSLRLK